MITESPLTIIHTYHCSIQRLIVRISPQIENIVVAASIIGVASPIWWSIIDVIAEPISVDVKNI